MTKLWQQTPVALQHSQFAFIRVIESPASPAARAALRRGQPRPPLED
jgi:hypothetical protein